MQSLLSVEISMDFAYSPVRFNTSSPQSCIAVWITEFSTNLTRASQVRRFVRLWI